MCKAQEKAAVAPRGALQPVQDGGQVIMPNMNPKKCPMPEQAPDVRNKNFDEVTLGYTAEMAVEEAQRCSNCKNKPLHDRLPGTGQDSRSSSRWSLRASSSKRLPRSRETSRCPLSAAVSARRRASASALRARHQGRGCSQRPSERFVADYARGKQHRKSLKPASNGHRVAIVGAAPAL